MCVVAVSTSEWPVAEVAGTYYAVLVRIFQGALRQRDPPELGQSEATEAAEEQAEQANNEKHRPMGVSLLVRI